MRRVDKRWQSLERHQWAMAWRHLRRTMNDRAEMAWRLKKVKWADTPESRYFWNLACDVAYSRAMPDHKLNRLGKVLA